MTVSELRALLAQYDDNATVVIAFSSEDEVDGILAGGLATFRELEARLENAWCDEEPGDCFVLEIVIAPATECDVCGGDPSDCSH